MMLNNNTASSKAQVDAFNAQMDDTFAGSQSYLVSSTPPPSASARKSLSAAGGRKKSSYFSRLLGSVTSAASPLTGGAVEGDSATRPTSSASSQANTQNPNAGNGNNITQQQPNFDEAALLPPGGLRGRGQSDSGDIV